MRKRDRELIEIGECTSLDPVIEQLLSFRDSLPPNSDPRLELRGDDNFGWRLVVTYFRDLTAEESELQARYAA